MFHLFWDTIIVLQQSKTSQVYRAVSPTRLQILRIDGEGIINDVIMHRAHDVICEKKCIKRCCGNCNIWANWFTSHQSQYCLLCNGIPEFVRECSMLTVKSWNNAKYSKKFYCRKVHSTRIGKLWRLSGRFQTLICRPGEIWRSGSTAGRYMWWQP